MNTRRRALATVLSLAALRKLRFTTTTAGAPLDPATRRDAELVARVALAALGVAAIAYQHEQDYDLRSRCLLVPTATPVLELVPRDGSEPQVFESSTEAARALLAAAAAAADAAGMGWPAHQVRMEPAPKLCELIKRSREVARVESAGDD